MRKETFGRILIWCSFKLFWIFLFDEYLKIIILSSTKCSKRCEVSLLKKGMMYYFNILKIPFWEITSIVSSEWIIDGDNNFRQIKRKRCFLLWLDDLGITTGRACISIDFEIVRISCGYGIYVREPQGFSPFCWVTQADCRAERTNRDVA